MIYIAFSTQSHKLFAKIFCRKFRHCAPVIQTQNKFILYQFIKHNNIAKITLSMRDIKILSVHGWKFIKYNAKFDRTRTKDKKSITCVQFTKNTCGIKNIFIQRPDTLFKYTNKKTPKRAF